MAIRLKHRRSPSWSRNNVVRPQCNLPWLATLRVSGCFVGTKNHFLGRQFQFVVYCCWLLLSHYDGRACTAGSNVRIPPHGGKDRVVGDFSVNFVRILYYFCVYAFLTLFAAVGKVYSWTTSKSLTHVWQIDTQKTIISSFKHSNS